MLLVDVTFNHTAKAMIAAHPKSEPKHDRAVSPWLTTYVDSGSTPYILIENAVLSRNTKCSSGWNGTSTGKEVKVRIERSSEFQHPGGKTGLVRPGSKFFEDISQPCFHRWFVGQWTHRSEH